MAQFNPVFTDAGRASIADATGQGLSAVITEVALGTGQYAVRDAEGAPTDAALDATALQAEQMRVPVYSGGSAAPGSLQLTAQIPAAGDGEPTFYIQEVGLIDADGTLIAIWSDAQNNLGYRSDLGDWHLSLGISWVDMPSDAVTVSVQNAPLAEQSTKQAQMTAQIQKAVEGAGYAWNPADDQALATAIDARVDTRVASLDVKVRKPIAVTPAGGATGTVLAPTLQASPYASPTRYSHVASQFIVRDGDGTAVHDSGERDAVTSYAVPAGALQTVTGYTWEVRYKGQLGDDMVWSTWSEPAAFETADTYVEAPALLTPTDGASDIGPQPTLTTEVFSVANGSDAHVSTRYQIATDSGFASIVWDSGDTVNNLTQIQPPDGQLAEGTTYYARARHTGQTLGASSWSARISFTTRDAFVYIAQPSVTAPADGATDVSLTPTITTSAFNVVGGSDTHAATQIQVRLESGSWDSPAYDTGEVAATTTHTLTDANGLEAERNYLVRARFKGQALGWSEWSDAVAFGTGVPAGEMIFSSPGQHTFTFPAGVYSVSIVGISPGAGGDGLKAPGGSGGGLGYKNDIAGAPGQDILVIIGNPGKGSDPTTAEAATNGGSVTFGAYLSVTGGAAAVDSTTPGDGGEPSGHDGGGIGGRGGAPASDYNAGGGGGGAGGYTGNGGDGGDGGSSGNPGSSGSGGGGGGGAGAKGLSTTGPDLRFDAGGGGGVGMMGAGANGDGGSNDTSNHVARGGQGGSQGQRGGDGDPNGPGSGGSYGGGGGATQDNDEAYPSGDGAPGAVRIIWGPGRSFPDNAA
jgi:hypothetical protein